MLKLRIQDGNGSTWEEDYDEGIPLEGTPLGMLPLLAEGRTGWRAVHVPSGTLMSRFGWSTELFARESIVNWFNSLDGHCQELLKIVDDEVICKVMPEQIRRLLSTADMVYIVSPRK